MLNCAANFKQAQVFFADKINVTHLYYVQAISNNTMNVNKLKQSHMRAMAAAQVDELVRVIDSMIEVANDSGQSNIVYKFPTNLIFDGVTPAESRLLVYSEIVKKYKTPMPSGGKGFTETYFADSPPRICIAWKIGLSQSERDDRYTILNGAKPPDGIKF